MKDTSIRKKVEFVFLLPTLPIVLIIVIIMIIRSCKKNGIIEALQGEGVKDEKTLHFVDKVIKPAMLAISTVFYILVAKNILINYLN